MKVLVTYASRHGSTRGIAERIAQTLQRQDLEVSLRPVGEDGGVEHYDAYVIGGASYLFSWLKEATAFVRAHERLLAARPVWLFSSGPVGTDKVDKQGRDVLVTSIPKEFEAFQATMHPRDVRIFFGAWDPTDEPKGLAERSMHAFAGLFPAMKSAMPVGDFRDWPEIEAWADAIARELLTAPDVVAPA